MSQPNRRAKIVCTLGPASHSVAMIRRLVKAGMDVARLNFSHGDHAGHAETLARVRRVAADSGRTVAILQDLQGPKLRVGHIPAGAIRLRRGATFTLTTRRGVATDEAVSVSYSDLPEDVESGDRILLDDGLLQLEVLGTSTHEVRCRVIEGGDLRSNKGINLPGRKLSTPALTAKDRRDLDFGIEQGVDYIALSFVREPEDLGSVRRVLKKHGVSIPVIAKLEKPQAVDNLQAIIDVADGIMVARGDLGVELPPERVPTLQKKMIRLARLAGKPVITATQMLESMVENSRPTRAEASDVANAVFDGTDAVMLSAETATGRHPVGAVQMMDRIIRVSEGSSAYSQLQWEISTGGRHSIPDAIGQAAAEAARELDARVIAVFTQSGGTARLVSKYRPSAPLYAFTPIPEVERRLGLVWGIQPRSVPSFKTTEEMVEEVCRRLAGERVVRKGDLVVFTAGTPVGHPGSTNFLKIHRVECS
jgi:pyruvate kinase